MKQKLKTHKGASKRFTTTGSGKIKRRHAFARHILTKKAANRKRKLGKSAILVAAEEKKVRAMLPYA